MSRPTVSKSRRLTRPQFDLLRELERGVVYPSPRRSSTMKWARERGYADRNPDTSGPSGGLVLNALGAAALASEQRLRDADARDAERRRALHAKIRPCPSCGGHPMAGDDAPEGWVEGKHRDSLIGVPCPECKCTRIVALDSPLALIWYAEHNMTQPMHPRPDALEQWRNGCARRANALHKGGRPPSVGLFTVDGAGLLGQESMTLEVALERIRLDALANPDFDGDWKIRRVRP